ncbi:MAG: hypothetical protein K2Z81_05975 [Cyanobacteria bacterium]|nr:hypothetical protein [Cyanobacteriota bacterium]
MNDVSIISHRDAKSKRITREEVNTLKFKVVGSQKKIKPLGYHIGTMMRSLLHYCTFTPATPRNQCKKLGHILPVGVAYRSKKDLICGECNKEIRSPEEIRKNETMAAVPPERSRR